MSFTFFFRFAPARRDFHHRYYCKMEPSHRLALHEFRRFGLVLPFGAMNAQFNTPNRFLFSPDCRWLQNDHANPLEAWEYVMTSRICYSGLISNTHYHSVSRTSSSVAKHMAPSVRTSSGVSTSTSQNSCAHSQTASLASASSSTSSPKTPANSPRTSAPVNLCTTAFQEACVSTESKSRTSSMLNTSVFTGYCPIGVRFWLIVNMRRLLGIS